MNSFFGSLSGFFVIASFIPYIKDVLTHKTRPQRMTFFIWSLLGTIAFVTQLVKGASFSLILPGLETLLIIVVFFLSLKFGMGGSSRKDFVALIVTAIGLLCWYLTKEAAVALYFVIIVDLAGTYLTLHKAYLNPESETLISWILSSLAGLFAALSVGKLDLILLSYPFYIFLANASIVGAIILGYSRNKKRKT